MIKTKADGFDWRLPMYGILGAVILALPSFCGNDMGAFLATIFLAALIALILLVIVIRHARRHGVAALSMVLSFCVLSWLLLRSSDDLRTSVRWLVHSKSYKSQVLNQPVPRAGEFKHVEWDDWGFPGAGDTVVYLVFDPTDQLAVAAKRRSSGTFNGIPCPVFKVHRLANNWYTALFYTDTDWNHCT
jgi:hypothetical protein